jgi:phosphopantetheinyl transferase (holo-ACP synthase)
MYSLPNAFIVADNLLNMYADMQKSLKILCANLCIFLLLIGRNYGYAKYATKESAMKAIQTLHGQNLSGQRIKVLEAEPPKSNDDGPAKKQKV